MNLCNCFGLALLCTLGTCSVWPLDISALMSSNTVLDDDDDDGDSDDVRLFPELKETARFWLQKCNQDHAKGCRFCRQCDLSAQVTYQYREKRQKRAQERSSPKP